MTDWVKAPGRYVMRNGDHAEVTAPTTIKYGLMGCHTWHGFKGTTMDGRELVWDGRGHFESPALVHPFDLVKRAPTPKPKAPAKAKRK